ncbi:type VII secretion protein EccE [Williamsia sp. M5A3_1d]
MASSTRLGTSAPTGGLTRILPLWPVIASEVVAIGVFVLLRSTGNTFAVAAAAAVAVGLIGAALAAHPSTGISVYGRIGRRLAFLRRTRRYPADLAIPFDLPQADGTTIGARWADDRLITVVRIARPVAPTGLIPSSTIVSKSQLSLGAVAKALSQFDIELESVDVIAHGWRARAAAHLTDPYLRLIARLPTVPQQDVWIVLRLDPLRCPDAIASRGGGSAGVLKTAMAATRRVANQLAHEGYRPTILTARGITDMASDLIDRASTSDPVEQWTSVDHGSHSTTAYSVDGPLDDELMTSIWTTPSGSTTCAVRLQRDGDRYAMTTVVRYSTAGGTSLTVPEELRLLDGRQMPALRRTLPVGRDHVPGLPTTSMTLDELDALRFVDGGHGQLFGADTEGQAVAVPLFGSDVRRVDLFGSAFLAQQIVVRAIAVGARVVIRTDRPEVWRAMVDNVNDSSTLFMFDSPVEQRNTLNVYTLCILDAREATEDHMVGTQLRIHRTAATPTRIDDASDVAIYQVQSDVHRVYVVTRSGTLAVSLVALPAEGELIERPRQRVRVPEPVGAGAPLPPISNHPGHADHSRPPSDPGPGDGWRRNPDGPGPGPGPGPGGGYGPDGPGFRGRLPDGPGGPPRREPFRPGPDGPPPQHRPPMPDNGFRMPGPMQPGPPPPDPRQVPPGFEQGPGSGRHTRSADDD